MQAYRLPSDIGFSSLEGYIDAAFAGFVIDLLPDSTPLTRSSFIDAVYSSELVAFQGLRFGPFGTSLCTPHTYVVALMRCTQHDVLEVVGAGNVAHALCALSCGLMWPPGWRASAIRASTKRG
jgi:hypothetical protein